MPQIQNKFIYGIDFGTSNSAVAYVNNKNVTKVIPIEPFSENPKVIRTLIYVSIKGHFSFGQEAVALYNKDVALARPAKKKIVNTGRLIKVQSPASAKSGFKPDQIIEEIIEIEDIQTGRLIQGIKGLLGSRLDTKLNLFNKEFEIEELVGLFLKELKKRADEYTNTDTKKVILGRPVHFAGGNDELASKRLVKAAKMAGFKEVVLQLEPVGAAYDFGINLSQIRTVLVFDFGGGTLDLSIVVFPQKKVIVNTGIALGGDILNSKLFSEKIAGHFGKGETYSDKKLAMPDSMYQKLQNWYAISLLKSASFFDSLEKFSYLHSDARKLKNLKSLVKNNLGFKMYEEIDRTKKALSLAEEDNFNLELAKINISDKIKRQEFENIIKYDLLEISDLIDQTLKQANLNTSQIDDIAITGGSSLIPSVTNILSRRFGEVKLKSKDTFTSVASGLALYGLEELKKE